MSEETKPLDVEATSQAVAVRETGGTLARALPQQESFESLMVLAKELCTTGFLPVAVKTPAQAVAIILTGRELGLGVMQSLRSISIIQGKPELAADLQLSIFHRDGGRSKWLLLTEREAKLWLRHPNGDEHTEIFTMEDAKRAGLANGANWQKYPKAMLRSRAITAGMKSVGFEPLSGAYAPGEIGGPEIVGPEPETVDPDQTSQNSGNVKASYSRPASQNAPGSTDAAPPPMTGGTPFRKQEPPKAKETAHSEGFATDAYRTKMIATLQAGPDQPSRAIVTEYFQKIDQLMPNEQVEDLPLRFVPANKEQMLALTSKLSEFGNGLEAARAFPPNDEPAKPKGSAKPKQVEVPRDPDAHDDPDDPDSPNARWRTFPMPFGKNAGVSLEDLEKNYLYGLWANFKVEREFNGKACKPEKIERDTEFRAMLDMAGTHYQFKTKE